MGLLDIKWKNFTWKRFLKIVIIYIIVAFLCYLLLPSFGGLIDGTIHMTMFLIVVCVIDSIPKKRKRKTKRKK